MIVKNKFIEFSSFLLIILMLILLFISSIRITYNDFSLKSYSEHIIVIGVLGLIVYIVSKIKNFKFSKYEIIIIILSFLACLSLVNAINVDVAIWGMVNRYEGLLVILSYYVLILLASNINSKCYLKIIVTCILIVGIINLIYGFIQKGLINITSFDIINSHYRYATGFNGNHMSFGSLMSLCLPVVLGIYLKSNKLFVNIVCCLLIFAFSIGVILSGTMSIFVGIFVVCMIILIDFIIKLSKRNFNDVKYLFLKFCSLFVICFIALIIGTKFNTDLKNDILSIFNEGSDIINGNVSDEFGTGRIHIWKNTIPKIKDNYLTGIGVDNFYYAFNPPLIDITSGGYVAKAHNDYLQKMLCEGVFSGCVFIVFLLYVFVSSIKKNKNGVHYGLLLAFVCYSVQAFFNISVIRVAPIYFIVIGLLIGYNRNIEINEK